jgi:hypothetical protein
VVQCKSPLCTTAVDYEGTQRDASAVYRPTSRWCDGRGLLRLSVATAIVILLGAGGGNSGERLPRNLGGLFARLIEETVVPPQSGTVLASLDDDAARPGCPDPYALWSASAPDDVGIRQRAHLEGRSIPGTVVGQSGWRYSSFAAFECKSPIEWPWFGALSGRSGFE